MTWDLIDDGPAFGAIAYRMVGDFDETLELSDEPFTTTRTVPSIADQLLAARPPLVGTVVAPRHRDTRSIHDQEDPA